jgi:predicted nuclease of restriction endonuclease-like (RecB) superfamily
MSDLNTNFAGCAARVKEILSRARRQALQTVNATMLTAYWHIGREIAEEEQRGQRRAEYGARLIEELAERLTAEFGKGYSASNLKLIRQFYATYADRVPPIGYTLSSESAATPHPLRPPEDLALYSGFKPGLSWSHYRVLMRVDGREARDFYEAECAQARWSVRELERQMATLLYERLARSRDAEQVRALSRKGHSVHRAEDLVKDPYVLEFTGLPEAAAWSEGDLETALLGRLQQFLLELGRDLFFVARQKRITIDGDHFYIDLVFYHRTLRCFLLIDLKVGRLTQQDVGQMLLYTGYYEAEEKRSDENPPIGLILCTDKNDAVVRYTLSQSAQKVFASRYQLHLPSEEQLLQELQREREDIEGDGSKVDP